MKVEIIYANTDTIYSEQVEMPEHSTVQNTIACSMLLQSHPEIDFNVNKIGIYGKLVSSDAIVKDNDRIEIYRPLKARTRRVQ
jgi:putative ubiquitin-RnfH superfamily antitoxin RatB of RatAB toxin-antitoxin module